jgi:trypsin
MTTKLASGDNKLMRILSILFVLILPLKLHAQERVIGGLAISGADAPWQLSLQSRSGTHFCGAVLIREDVLLTAAHCVWSDDSSSFSVKGQSPKGMLKELKRLSGVKEIVVHPDFDPNDVVAHDLALIQLTSPIAVSSSLKPIAWADETFPHQMDQEFHQLFDIDFVVSGWGMTTPPNLLQAPSEQLMAASLKAVASSNVSLFDPQIRKYLEETYDLNEKTFQRIQSRDSRTLIVEGRNAIGGPCSGDSGGPLVQQSPRGSVLVGISSYTAGGAKQCLGVGVFTNVQAYAAWIHQQMRSIQISR